SARRAGPTGSPQAAWESKKRLLTVPPPAPRCVYPALHLCERFRPYTIATGQKFAQFARAELVHPNLAQTLLKPIKPPAIEHHVVAPISLHHQIRRSGEVFLQIEHAPQEFVVELAFEHMCAGSVGGTRKAVHPFARRPQLEVILEEPRQLSRSLSQQTL